MALPDQLNPTVPPDVGEAVSLGPSRIRALAAVLADFFGVPVAPNTLTAEAMSITTSGVVSLTQAGATVAADPTAALGIASKQYVDRSSMKFGAAANNGSDAYTVANTIPLPALYHGYTQHVNFTSPNATTTPTLNIDGTGVFPIVVGGTQSPGVAQLSNGLVFVVMFNASLNAYQIINQAAFSFWEVPLSGGPSAIGQVYQFNGSQFVPAQVGPPSQSVASTTTLLNTSVGAGSSATLYQLTATAPSASTYPGLTWRPVVSFAAFAQAHTNASNCPFSVVLTASGGSFTSIGNAANVFTTLSAHTVGCTGMCFGAFPISSGTSMTFTLTGYAPQTQADIASAPDTTTGTVGGIEVFWMQAV